MTVKELLKILRHYSINDDYLFYFEQNDQLFSINTVDVDNIGDVLLFSNPFNGRKKASITIKELIRKLSNYSDDIEVYYSKDSFGELKTVLSFYRDPDRSNIARKAILFKIPE